MITLDPAVVDLGLALGVLSANGSGTDLDSTWFGDPFGRIGRCLSDSTQRAALERFLADLLSDVDLEAADASPDQPLHLTLGQARGEGWEAGFEVIIATSASATVVSISASIGHDGGGSGLGASLTGTVPLLSVTTVPGGGTAMHMALGTDEGDIRLSGAVTLPPVAAGTAGATTLGTVTVAASIPTKQPVQTPAITVTVKDLRLNGSALGDVRFDLTRPEELGAEVVQLLVHVIEALAGSPEANALLRALGIDADGGLPALPVTELISGNLDALRVWFAQILASPGADGSLQRLLVQVAKLFDRPPLTGSGTPADPFVITVITGTWSVGLEVVATADPTNGKVDVALALEVSVDSGTNPPLFGQLQLAPGPLSISTAPAWRFDWVPSVALRVGVLAGDHLHKVVDVPASPATPKLTVEEAFVGLVLVDGKPSLSIEARRVDIGDHPHDVLDLSSVDALAGAASTVLSDLVDSFADMLGVGPETEAIATLLGLRAPAAAPAGWPATLGPAELFNAPLSGIGGYYARVAAMNGGWRAMVDALGQLVGGAAPTVTGNGNPQEPWRVAIVSGAHGELDLLVWLTADDPLAGPDATPHRVHVGLAFRPGTVSVGTAKITPGIDVQVCELWLDSPPPLVPGAAGPPFRPPAISLAPRLGVRLLVDDGLEVPLGPMTIGLTSIEIEAVAASTEPHLSAGLTVAGISVAWQGETVELGDLRVSASDGGVLLDIEEIPWAGFEELLGRTLLELDGAGVGRIGLTDLAAPATTSGLPITPWPLGPLGRIAVATGWVPWVAPFELIDATFPGRTITVDPAAQARLSLAGIATDPIDAFSSWLLDTLGGIPVSIGDAESDPFVPAVSGTDRSLVLVALLASVLRTPTLSLDPLTDFGGVGSPNDPWTISLPGTSALSATVWTEPDGPAIGDLNSMYEALVPGLDPAAPSPTLEDAVALLTRAAGLLPEIAAAIGSQSDFGPVMTALADRLEGTDGLVPMGSQQGGGWPTVGWSKVDGAPAGHLSRLDARDLTALDPAGTAIPIADTVFVHTAATSDGSWRFTAGTTPSVIDCSAPGLAAASIDLGSVGATGPWVVRLPTLASAGSAANVAERLRRAVDAVRSHTAGRPLRVVAHSTAGRALAAAVARPGIARAVFIGTPFAGADVGLVVDAAAETALRRLQRLRALFDGTRVAADESDPFRSALRTLDLALDGMAVPGSGTGRLTVPLDELAVSIPPTATSPTVDPGTKVVVVGFGLSAADVAAGIYAITTRAIAAALSARTTTGTSTTAGLGVGVRIGLPEVSVDGIRMQPALRLDLAHLDLGVGPREVPRLLVTIDVHRPGQHLVTVPGGATGDRRPPLTIGAARLEIEMQLLTGATAARLALDEVSVLGVHRPRVVVGATLVNGAVWSLPVGAEDRAAVTAVVDSLRNQMTPAAAWGALARVAGLLRLSGETTGTAVASASSVPPLPTAEGVLAFLADPGPGIAAALAEGTALVELLADVAAGAAATPEGIRIPLGDFVVTLLTGSDPGVRVETVGDGLALGPVSIGVGVEGRASGHHTGRVEVGAASPLPLLPAPRLVLALDGDASPPVSVSVRWPSWQLDAGLDIPVFPVPDVEALAGATGLAILGEVARAALESVYRAEPDFGPLLRALALVDAATDRVRNPIPLVLHAERWLADPSVLGDPAAAPGTFGLDVAKLVGLIEAIAALVGGALPGGLLPLVPGIALSVGSENGVTVVAVVIDAGADRHLRVALAHTAGQLPAIQATGSYRVDLGAGAPAEAIVVRGGIGATGPELSLGLVRGPGSPPIVLSILPPASWEAIGSMLASQAVPALAMVLDGLAESTTFPDVATFVDQVGTALGLRVAGSFSADALNIFAADPVDQLVGHLPALITAISTMFEEILPSGLLATPAVPGVVRVNAGPLRLSVEAEPGPVLTIELTTAEPGIVPVDGVRVDVLLTVNSSVGLTELAVLVALTDDLLELGGNGLHPAVQVALTPVSGSISGSLDVTLPVSVTAPATAFVLSVPFSGSPSFGVDPVSVSVADALLLLATTYVLPALMDIVLDQAPVRNALAHSIAGGTTWADALTTTGTGAAINRGLLRQRVGAAPFALEPDAFDLDQLLERLLNGVASIATALAAEVAELEGIGIGLAPVTDHSYGLRLSLVKPLEFGELGPVSLSLTGADDWEHTGGARAGSIDLYVVKFVPPSSISFAPSIVVDRVGLHLAGVKGQPLLQLGPVRLGHADLHAFWRQSAQSGEVAVRAHLGGLGLDLTKGATGGNPVAAKVIGSGSSKPDQDPGDVSPLAPGFDISLIVPGADQRPFDVVLGTHGRIVIAVQRTFGPLYVDQIGVEVVEVHHTGALPGDQGVKASITGQLDIFALHAAFDGLSVTIPVRTPKELATWQIGLDGLAISYQGGPVSIAGGLLHEVTDEGHQYLGMLQVSSPAFGIAVLAGYGEYEVPQPPGATGEPERYTSAFAFAALQATIGGPPVFFVVGLALGLGINRRLRMPSIDEVADYTLIAALRDGSPLAANPGKAMKQLGKDFPAERGAFWLAAGVKFTTFAVLKGIAMVAVEVDGGELDVAVMGLVGLQLPDAQAAIVSVQLALLVRFSTREGTILVAAQLTKESWLISPDCRLTGGFAFQVWFQGPHRGDFVITMGGYNQYWTAKPAYYPVPPRLGLDWHVSDVLAITGGTYFAITPSCVMAGGGLSATFDSGIAWASFRFEMDAIVSWDPFFYRFDAWIDIKAGLRLSAWHPSVCVSVRLTVQGPPLHGFAQLDIAFFHLTIPFGPEADPPTDADLTWDEFSAKYLTAAGSPFTATVAKGMLPPANNEGESGDGSPTKPFRVGPQFVITFGTRLAAKTLAGVPASPTGAPAAELWAGPMRRKLQTSELRVTLAGSDVVASAVSLTPIYDQLPGALWQKASRASTQPAGADTVRAITGARLEVAGRPLSNPVQTRADRAVPVPSRHLPLPDPTGAPVPSAPPPATTQSPVVAVVAEPALVGVLAAPTTVAAAPIESRVPPGTDHLPRRPPPTLEAATAIARVLGGSVSLAGADGETSGDLARSLAARPAGGGSEWRRDDHTTDSSPVAPAGPVVLDASGGRSLAAGEVQVWTLEGFSGNGIPPRLTAEGELTVRLLLLDAAGALVADRTASELDLEVPSSATELVAVGVGRTPDRDGEGPVLAGWHIGQTTPIVSDIAVARGALVTGFGSPARPTPAVDARLCVIDQTVVGGGPIGTRFPVDTASIAVFAEHETDVAPEVIGGTLTGERALRIDTVLGPAQLWGVRADPEADAVFVRVACSGLRGVAGAALLTERLAASLGGSGAFALTTSPFLQAAGRSTLRWHQSDGVR